MAIFRQQRTSLLLAFAGILAVAMAYSMLPGPHAFSDCTRCHLTDSSGKIQGRRLTASVTTLCAECHAAVLNDGYLHPVDVRPRHAVVPPDLPLSVEGEITCATCHDLHGQEDTSFGLPGHYLRRADQGREFCKACHHEQRNRGTGHADSIGESHFRPRYAPLSASGEIDPLSLTCLSCHDGSYSQSTAIRAGVWTHGRDFMKYDSGSHPIGVDYEAARSRRGRRTDLRPMAVVDPRIRFFEGKVGCGSCHDPYSAIEKHLVMSDRESRLCLSCHLIAG